MESGDLVLTTEEDNLIDFLEAHYGCHTIILYGSRGKGTHKPESDWDVLGISDRKEQNWHHGAVTGVGEVSAYIYPETDVPYVPTSPSRLYDMHFVRFRHGRVLVQEHAIGDEIIERARSMFKRGVDPIPKKMLSRNNYVLFGYGVKNLRDPEKSNAEKFLIRCETLPLSMMLYFKQRRMWRPGHGEALDYIKKADPVGYALVSKALEPNATADDLERWLTHMMDAPDMF